MTHQHTRTTRAARTTTQKRRARRLPGSGALGPLPERGLTPDQIEAVRNVVESGERFINGVTYRGKGLAAAALEMGISHVALRHRLLQCGREVAESVTADVVPIDPAKSKIMTAWLATLPVTDRVADADRAAFAEQMQQEMNALLPLVRRKGLTPEQIIQIRKIVQGLGVGAKGVAPFLKLATANSAAEYLAIMNLKVAVRQEYRLGKTTLLPDVNNGDPITGEAVTLE